MKTTPFFAGVLSTGVLLTALSPACFAQAISADSSGNLREDSALNLAGPRISGILPPAHLGTGAPSSATVLRGDGSWVGTTPSGATIASTNGLLRGDGAGNAAGIASSSDLQRVLQMRAQTARAFTFLPANLLGSANLVIRNGTLNADGTLTIPANDYIQYRNSEISPDGSFPKVPHFAYAVSTTDAPVGQSGGFEIHATYPNGLTYDNGVSSAPEPGVSRYVFTNGIGGGDYTVFVQNHASSPVTIFPPVLTTTDVGVLPMQSFAENVAVVSRPVLDLDFTRFARGERASRFLAEKLTTLAADSVHGSAGNAGTLYAPKLTLQQTVTDGSVFGLYRGSTFGDSLPLSTLNNAHGVVVQDVALGSQQALPVISALDPVPSASFLDDSDGTYSFMYTPEDSIIANDGYQNVYAVEINVALEATAPVAARRRMIDVTSAAAVVNTVGSAWLQAPGTGAGQSGSTTDWRVILHPTSGAPAEKLYRYEVVSRYCPIRYPQGATGDCSISGVELVGSSYGYGSLGAPTGFVGDRLAILHATTHSAVLGGGSLQRSVFYEAGDDDSISLAWYTGSGAGLNWSMNNVLFYLNVGDRPANGLIAHTNGTSGSNYGRGDISDCAFLGARWSDGSLHGQAMDYVNVNAGTINRVYVQGIQKIFGVQMPLVAETKSSVFRQVNVPNVQGNFHDNVVLSEGGPGGANLCLFPQNGANAANNIFWARGIVSGNAGEATVSGIQCAGGVSTATFQRNIVVINPTTNTTGGTYVSVPGPGLAMDYNLVINLTKGDGGFFTFGGGGNAFTWAQYLLKNPTLDQHSLYLDLSGDPRGLKAVFADPDNGDFRWAQTDVALQCQTYCQANNVGPAAVMYRWPVVPAVDAAVRSLTDL